MGRAPCCDKNNVKRGSWSPEEDATLKNYLQNNGTGGNWISLPQRAGLRRCGKSCRLRWLNYLRPDIKHGAFTEEEDNIIISMYYKMGSRWSVIATNLPGRTDNDVKNHWNTKLKKKLFAGSNNNNKINLTIPKFNNNNNNNNNLNFTNNNIINPIFQLPPNYNYSNTNQVHNHQVYVPNPSFSDLLSHCTNSTSMSLLPNDPFSNPISTRYPFNQTLMMPQASSSITNVDNVNVYTHEEVSSGSKSSSIVYGSGFDDDPFLSDLEFGLMQEEVVMDNPECNFDVGHEDIKPQGLGQGVVNN